MPGLPSDVAHSSVSRPSARRHVARRYLTGLSAAGVTAAIALTGIASDASASPGAPARVVTLTSNSSAPTGHLTLQVKYKLEPRGRNKLLSVTFSGASKISLRHPALIVSLRPVPLLQRRAPGGGGRSIPVIAFTVILKIHNVRNFSGALPAKVLAQISKVFASPPRHRLMPGGFVLSATVASVSRPKSQVGITVPVGLQVGVLLGPALP